MNREEYHAAVRRVAWCRCGKTITPAPDRGGRCPQCRGVARGHASRVRVRSWRVRVLARNGDRATVAVVTGDRELENAVRDAMWRAARTGGCVEVEAWH